MVKIKKRLTEKKGLLISYVLTFAIAFFFFQKATIYSSDDLWFKMATEHTPLHQFIVNRYFTWTGRLTVEALLTTILKLPSVYWHILGSASFVIFSIAVSYIVRYFYEEINTVLRRIIVYWISFCIPFYIWIVSDFRCGTLPYVENVTCSVTSAGIYWYTGYFNYFLPITLTFLMISLFLAMKKSRQKWNYALAIIICSFYVSSSEQSAMLWMLFCLYTFTEKMQKKCWKEKENKKVKIYCEIPEFTVYFVSVITTLFFITAPGNRMRVQTETKNVMPIFSELSLFDKLQRGIGYGFSSLIERFILVIIFIFIVAVIIQTIRKQYFYLGLSTVGICLSICLFYCTTFIENWHLIKASVTNKSVEWSFSNLFVTILLLIILAFTIIIVFEGASKKKFAVLLLTSALMSVVLIGLSPTILTSGIRTQYLSFILLTILFIFLIFEMFITLKLKRKKVLNIL